MSGMEINMKFLISFIRSFNVCYLFGLSPCFLIHVSVSHAVSAYLASKVSSHGMETRLYH